MTKQMMIDRIYLEVMGSEFVDPSDYESCLLGDVLDWFYSNIELPVVERRRTCDTILFEWKDKRKPLQDQPIECIEYIYNLLCG